VKRLKTITTINGRKIPYSKARLSVFDNSLLYAEGLFETFLAIDDRVMFLEQHCDRLYRGAQVTGLSIPVERAALARWMKRTLRDHPSHIKKLRLTITSGESARWVGVQGEPKVILSASPHELPAEPFRIQVSDLRVDQDSVFRRIKTISYAIHAAALRRARAEGADDALLLNEKDQVAEVTSANIFWVKNGRIYTPPISAGCLEGVTRQILLEESNKLSIPISEKTESLKGLVQADECFICSSLKLVIGVATIHHDGVESRFSPGPVTDRLTQHFRKLTGLQTG
jgi:branched-chain amino acid aminotransferase